MRTTSSLRGITAFSRRILLHGVIFLKKTVTISYKCVNRMSPYRFFDWPTTNRSDTRWMVINSKVKSSAMTDMSLNSQKGIKFKLGARWEKVVNKKTPPLYALERNLVPTEQEAEFSPGPVSMGVEKIKYFETTGVRNPEPFIS
jgi:hypothetical protein